MIEEIQKALKDVRTALTLSEDDDVLRMLQRVEERLQNWLYSYMDDGK